MGTNVKIAAAVLFLGGYALAGYIALTAGDGDNSSSQFVVPSLSHTPTLSEAPYKGAVYTGERSVDMPRVAPVGRSTGGATYATYQVQSSRTDLFRNTNSMQTTSSSGGGRAVGSGSGYDAPGTLVTGSVTATSSGGGMLAVQSVSLPSMSYGGGHAGVIAPVSPTVPGLPMGSGINPGSGLDVYEGDAPGEIVGAENGVLDNAIINCYGLPVGDSYWPFIFFSLLYMSYLLLQKRRVIVATTKTLVSNGKTILHNPHNITYAMKPISQYIHFHRKRTAACLLALVALLALSSTRAWAQTHTENVTYKDVQGNDSVVTYNVVYLNLGSGDNSKDGASVANAVKDWATAYGKLPKYTGTTDADRDAAWDSNIIVVCDKSGQLNITDGNTGKRPATITGAWPWVDREGNSPVPSTIQGKVNLSSSPRIGADTKFKYLNFGQGMLSMYLHDCTFDVGCFMNDISSDLTAENGALRVEGDVSKAPEFQVFLYANSQNFDPSKPDGGLPTQTKPVTLTIKSGKFGRILTNRLTGTDADAVKKRYVMGRPSSPFLCVVNLDVDPNTSTGVWNTRNDVYDIAYLCAGMTQGMVYSDVQFNIKRGTIGTLVAAMQGNSHTATATVGISNSSFFGRTEVNINPVQDEDVTIYRYFATCFGRYTENAATKGTSNAAFYGKSTLNMHGGTIESGVFATAGGIAGLKSPDGAYHTIDKFIPYLDEGADYVNYPFMGIKYQAYDETGTKTMPTFTTTLHGTPETIDLSETVTEINIYGGTVNGGVFGGGYGFSPEMPTERAIAGAGSFWGETRVNIYGGTITGGVYGGGAGASNYFNASTSNDQRDGFSTVASVYGDTHVNIYGGDISGGIYGAGKGLDYQAAGSQKIWDGAAQTTVNCQETEFANVAKVYGNTNVIIDPTDPDWTFRGNIYGGGAKGAVEGSTNVQVLGGIILGDVYAGGEGEEGHPDKAKVTGTTKVTIGE